MKFTKEEISLCKQVAENYRKKIKRGDWIIDDKGEVCLIENIDKDNTMMAGYGKNIRYFSLDYSEIIPLWTISDCLEFLREKGWTNYQFNSNKEGKTELHVIQTPFEFKSNQEIIETGTFLESLLKAILAVLEEEK